MATEQRRKVSDQTVTAAIDRLIPWQRNVLFLLGATVFLVPVLGHVINELFRGLESHMSILHLTGDSIFLFAGILGMCPQLAIRVVDHLAVWRGLKK